MTERDFCHAVPIAIGIVQHLYVPTGILDPETLTCIRAGEFRVTRERLLRDTMAHV